MTDHEPFSFYTERRLVLLTGCKAGNLPELLSHMRQVSGSSIFFHTHQQYLAHHFETPVFHNDFSTWVSRALQEEALSEKLAAIDLLAFSSIRQLREALVAIVESHLGEIQGRQRECFPGDEFHFCESHSFIMPTGIVVGGAADFFARMPEISNPSLYFHFFEARLRLERRTNDFSQWLYYRGEEKIARAIDEINPYELTLGEMRNTIIKIGQEAGYRNGDSAARL